MALIKPSVWPKDSTLCDPHGALWCRCIISSVCESRNGFLELEVIDPARF